MDLSVAAHIASDMSLIPQQATSPPESSEDGAIGWGDHSSSSSISPPLDPTPQDEDVDVSDIAAVPAQIAPIDWKMILGPQPTPVQAPVPVKPTPTVIPPAPIVIGPKISSTEIEHDAKFFSYAAFDTVFEQWKQDQLHPFRVASSETLKMPDGTVNDVFRYRYVVFNCAHYGQPRKRGAGKRPKQNYLPCGCKAMLRLNYNFQEQALKISTLVTEHNGHETSPNSFDKLNNSSKMRASGTPQTRIVSYRRPRDPLTDSVRPAPSLLRTSGSDSGYAEMVAKAKAISIESNITIKEAMLQEQRKKLANLLTKQAARSEMFQSNTLLQLALGGANEQHQFAPLSTISPQIPMQGLGNIGVFQGNMNQNMQQNIFQNTQPNMPNMHLNMQHNMHQMQMHNQQPMNMMNYGQL